MCRRALHPQTTDTGIFSLPLAQMAVTELMVRPVVELLKQGM
jgi:hypothetical protein